jgi:predicted secreted protein
MNRSKPQTLLRTWLILGGLIAALSACASGGAAGGTPRNIILPPEGGKIDARPGDILVITLPANPSTGYTWEVDPLDAGVLAQEGEPVTKAESDLIGAPSAMTFRFKAAGPGQVILSMSYRRPWEEGVAPVKTYQAEISVK